MSQYQKGKTNMDFTEARDSEWQWHQLGHMQPHTVCKSAPRSRLISMPAPDHAVFYRLDALPATQPTALKHCILAVKRLLCQLFFWIDATTWNRLALHSKHFMAGGSMADLSPSSTYANSDTKNVTLTPTVPIVPFCHQITRVFHSPSHFIRLSSRTLDWQPLHGA